MHIILEDGYQSFLILACVIFWIFLDLRTRVKSSVKTSESWTARTLSHFYNTLYATIAPRLHNSTSYIQLIFLQIFNKALEAIG
jgi:hypothetical protein